MGPGERRSAVLDGARKVWRTNLLCFPRVNMFLFSKLETARFHLALRMIGTDFSMMEKFFPKRTRVELKRKFKCEEKCNVELIDKSTSNPLPFDPSQFIEDSGIMQFQLFVNNFFIDL